MERIKRMLTGPDRKFHIGMFSFMALCMGVTLVEAIYDII